MKLSEIIDVFVAGDWGKDSPSLETPHAVSCVRGADIVPITNNEFANIPLRYISERSFQQKLLQVGDIVIEKSGGSPTQSTGRAVYISQALLIESKDVVCSNFCVAFRVKESWNPYFIYQYWQYLYNCGVFFNFEGKTSGIKNLQLDIALSTIEIEPYPIERQVSIANCLESFDKKIALNRSINHNLEAMAKQLYDYWFLQFDFPDENGMPYKSSGGKMVWNEKLKREIPEGWKVGKVKDFLRIFTGKKDVSKSTPGKYKFFSCAPESITSNEYIHDGEAVLVSGNGSYTGRVSYYNGKFDLYQRTYACVPIKDDSKVVFFYYTLRYLFQPVFTGGKRGSSIPYIVLGDLADFKFAYNEQQTQKFVKLVSPIFDLQFDNRTEDEGITMLRDSLLPLLMNGQVEIDVERFRLNYDLSND